MKATKLSNIIKRIYHMSLIFETNRYNDEAGVVVTFTIEGADYKAEFAMYCTESGNDLSDYESFYGDENEIMADIEMHRCNFDHKEHIHSSLSYS